jgi:hypothetical protein
VFNGVEFEFENNSNSNYNEICIQNYLPKLTANLGRCSATEVLQRPLNSFTLNRYPPCTSPHGPSPQPSQPPGPFFSLLSPPSRARLSYPLFPFLLPLSVLPPEPRACECDGMAGTARASSESRARLGASASDAPPRGNPSSTPVPRLPTLGPSHQMPSTPCPSSERHGWPRGNSALASCPSPRIKSALALHPPPP